MNFVIKFKKCVNQAVFKLKCYGFKSHCRHELKSLVNHCISGLQGSFLCHFRNNNRNVFMRFEKHCFGEFCHGFCHKK